jgi:PTS system nitrogen regulatory IIA component
MQNKDLELLTIEEVAKYLRVSERTVYDWANKGEIPCGKLGTTWRFKRTEIERWVDEHLHTAPKAEEPRPLSLGHLLEPSRVILLDAKNKHEALETLIDNLAEAPEIHDRDALAEAVYRREELMSTGIGLGVAVPHVRIPSVSTLAMSVGLNREELTDYESLDSIPVRLIFLIAARETQHAQHLKTLSSISTIVRNRSLLQQVLKAPDAGTLYTLLTGKAPGDG